MEDTIKKETSAEEKKNEIIEILKLIEHIKRRLQRFLDIHI